MPYDEPRYIQNDTLNAFFPQGTQTYTASGHVLTQTLGYLTCPQACTVVAGGAHVQAAGQGKDAYVLNVLNGTTTIGTISPADTAGSGALLVLGAGSGSVVTAGNALALTLTGTGTAAAAQTNPLLAISIVVRKQFV
jgi:hypothetical protein